MTVSRHTALDHTFDAVMSNTEVRLRVSLKAAQVSPRFVQGRRLRSGTRVRKCCPCRCGSFGGVDDIATWPSIAVSHASDGGLEHSPLGRGRGKEGCRKSEHTSLIWVIRTIVSAYSPGASHDRSAETNTPRKKTIFRATPTSRIRFVSRYELLRMNTCLGAVDLCTYFAQQYIGSHIITNANATLLA